MRKSEALLVLVFSIILSGGANAPLEVEKEDKQNSIFSRPQTTEEVEVAEDPDRTAQLEAEVLALWEAWLQEQDAWTKKKLEKPKQKWPVLAKYLVEAVEKYQNEEIRYNDYSEKTTQLPKGKDVHLVLATMAIFETKVRNGIVGDLGEIGILQCHPRWCLTTIEELDRLPRRQRVKVAKENPRLNIKAAVKHLAISYGVCGIEVKRLGDWKRPVSYYGAGSKAIEKGRCVEKRFARKRVNTMMYYREILMGIARDI